MGVSVPDGLLCSEARPLVGRAAGGRKVAAGRLGPLAHRGRRQALDAVTGEPALGIGLILPSSALLVQAELFFFFFLLNPPPKK